MKNSGMFAFFEDSYYRVNEDLSIVIPTDADYKTMATNSQVIDSVDLGVIDAYAYHTDLLTECNSDRVACMKEMLIGEKVKKIEELNNDYVIGIDYELYNKEGQLLKSGYNSVKAIYHTAIIPSPVAEDNSMGYRKAMLFDGKIQIQIPEISRYGIKNKYTQHPFTVRITSISVSSTIGENYFCGEETTQLSAEKIYEANHAHIIHRRNPHITNNNFASHFITNAHVGTTVIDQTVVPAVLEVDKEYEVIDLCTIECDKNSNVAKFNHKLKLIEVNVEVLLDNSNVVYDVNDIKEIIELNNEPEEGQEEPEIPPIDDNPTEDGGNTDEPSDPSEPGDGDNTTDEEPETPPTDDGGNTDEPTEGEGGDGDNTDEPSDPAENENSGSSEDIPVTPSDENETGTNDPVDESSTENTEQGETEGTNNSDTTTTDTESDDIKSDTI